MCSTFLQKSLLALPLALNSANIGASNIFYISRQCSPFLQNHYIPHLLFKATYNPSLRDQHQWQSKLRKTFAFNLKQEVPGAQNLFIKG